MGDNWVLGRIRGIPISIHWSWLVVFALIAWSLTAYVFPDQNPGLSDGTYLAMALVATGLFFLSLLLHELGHAFTARREGMQIEGVTLWLFGGVASFRGMFPSAGAEFRIAIAGPLVSLVLGVVFVLTAWAADLPAEIDGVAAWLGFINLLLLAFNLLPALPLDGGRVLRSLLWRVGGDFAAATRSAAAVGRAFGFLFIGLGLAQLFFLSSFGGVWLAFMGWFLLGAASAEARYVATRQAFGGLRVRDLMSRDPASVDADLTLGDFMDRVVWNRRYTTYPVVETARPVGLLPFRCVAQVPRAEWESRRVRDCMIPLERVTVLSEDDEVIAAHERLGETGRALVLDGGGRLTGLLSISDLARALEVGTPRRLAERRA